MGYKSLLFVYFFVWLCNTRQYDRATENQGYPEWTVGGINGRVREIYQRKVIY